MRASSSEKKKAHKYNWEGIQAFIWERIKAECLSDSYEYKPPMKELSVHEKKSIVKYRNKKMERDG